MSEPKLPSSPPSPMSEATSTTPPPASATAFPIAMSSSAPAKVPGTGSPSRARCSIVREEVNPRAPASIPSWTIFAISTKSSGVGSSFRAPLSPMTYARTEPCGTCVAMSMTLGISSRASKYSGKVSQFQSMPSERAAPGMSSTPSMSWISQSWLSDRAGANPTPQFPNTVVVTPWKDEGLMSGSQVACPS